MKSRKTLALASFLLILFFSHCAKEGMPPGGPVDTAPPKVISVSPKPDSTRVDLSSKIHITFSERMSNKQTEESVFLSPFPKKPLDLKWRGKKLILSPAEPLLKDKTYVVTIGTGVQDLRGNHLSESYTFAFSTGTALDYGSISGTVWMRKKNISPGLTTEEFQTESGVSLWAYFFSDTAQIDPERDKPDYVTQSDTDGNYSLKSLSSGPPDAPQKYRLFAVDDLNRDLLWNPDNEAIGVSTQDVELTSANLSKDHLDFIIELRDTTRPTLVNCQSLNKNQVRLDFDENLRAESVSNPDHFKIKSVSTSESLKVDEIYYQENTSKNIFILTQDANPQEKYEIKTSDLEDESGNFLDTSANTCIFTGSAISDTAGPKIVSSSPQEGAPDVLQDVEIKLIFDQPPNHPSVDSSFSLSDSNGVFISGKSRWENPNTFVFSPDSLLLGMMKYQIKLESEKILDLLGNFMSDSVFSSSFMTLNPDTLGLLSGKVQALGKNISGDIVVTLHLLNEAKKTYRKNLLQPDSFLFENILPGNYMVSAYIDLNRDGSLTIGSPKPFVLSEPFTFFPDTVYVRSRWETEKVNLQFR